MYSGLTVKWNSAQRFGAADSVEPRAVRLFDRALRTANPTGLQRLFSHAVIPLKTLGEAARANRITNRVEGGARAVRLDQITGSLNKAADFDAEFHPLQRHSEFRWVKVATAMLRGVALPPIELIQVGEAYFVADGHHRVSVARALGYKYLDALVMVWTVEPGQAA